MLRRSIFVVTALALVATSSVAFAQAARVSAAQGTVYANRGGQMVPVRAGSALQSGDRVMVTSGSASVTYADGCNVRVSARSMVVVGANSPCAGGSSDLVRVANGDADGDQGYGRGWVWENGAWVWVGFGVITAIVVGSELSSDEDAPASP